MLSDGIPDYLRGRGVFFELKDNLFFADQKSNKGPKAADRKHDGTFVSGEHVMSPDQSSYHKSAKQIQVLLFVTFRNHPGYLHILCIVGYLYQTTRSRILCQNHDDFSRALTIPSN